VALEQHAVVYRRQTDLTDINSSQDLPSQDRCC
jgi:hypothetical protein